MSVQWYGVASLLYVELAVTLLLLIPFLKPATWKRILSLPLFGSIQTAWTTIFYATLFILIILFADSIRTMMKYGDLPATMTLDAKLDYRLQECRGQRNFYISGFTLFLILVIRRLVTLIYQRAQLEANVTALKKQAEQANRELQRRMQEEADKESGKTRDKSTSKPSQKEEEKEKEGEEKEGEEKEGEEKEEKEKEGEEKEGEEKEGEEKEGEGEVETVGPSQEDYDKLQEDLRVAQADLEAMRKQAQSTNAEYDRLSEEHQKLQTKMQEQEGSVEDKKDL